MTIEQDNCDSEKLLVEGPPPDSAWTCSISEK